MLQAGRLRHILDLLAQHEECSVEDLGRACGVSEMTIRRDLGLLARRGQIERTHGGAARTSEVSFQFQFLDRAREQAPAKEQIARAAAALVREGQSVLLDSGTTTLAIARALRTRGRLTIITTSLPVASALQNVSDIEVLLLGGYLRRESPDLAGALTESNLENLRADIAFLGADGIDARGNVYNKTLAIGRMLTKMAASAKSVYVVADHSKLGRTALARYVHARQFDGLITDAKASPSMLRKLRSADVRVIIAGSTAEGNGYG